VTTIRPGRRSHDAALSSLRAHISRLRSALAVSRQGGTGMLTHTSGGYALHVARESVRRTRVRPWHPGSPLGQVVAAYRRVGLTAYSPN
jgi:hypothetical protein